MFSGPVASFQQENEEHSSWNRRLPTQAVSPAMFNIPLHWRSLQHYVQGREDQMPDTSSTWILDSGHPSRPDSTAGAVAKAACAKGLKCHVLQAEIWSDNFRKFVHALDWWLREEAVLGFRTSELFKPAVQKCKGEVSGLWKKLNWTVFPCHQQQQRGCPECYQVLGFDMKLCITRKKHLLKFSSPTLL